MAAPCPSLVSAVLAQSGRLEKEDPDRAALPPAGGADEISSAETVMQKELHFCTMPLKEDQILGPSFASVLQAFAVLGELHTRIQLFVKQYEAGRRKVEVSPRVHNILAASALHLSETCHFVP